MGPPETNYLSLKKKIHQYRSSSLRIIAGQT